MKFFDEYSLKARVSPSVLTILPFLMVIFFLIYNYVDLSKGIIGGVFFSMLFIYFLSQWGRDAGLKKQDILYERIGGKPTTVLLRHSNNQLSSITKKRYHDFLNQKIPNLNLPLDLSEESIDPNLADEKYNSAVDWLRKQTRDTTQHTLLLSENTSYGFRRNLWGLKPVGIALNIMIGLFSLYGMYLDIFVFYIFFIISSVCICLWVFMIKNEWVKIPAFAYAKILLEYCEQ